VSVFTTNLAVFPVNSFLGMGDFSWYSKANPGKNNLSINPFNNAG
jgi:hypothetical protein